ncbi:hypothetical protein M4I21_17385 [Cellulophaga sp. 20_2_10]|nr:hypothetical protein [Cellulophaga sp. 20_2_10]
MCYNRFRYYSPDSGTYISQDPIGLEGNNPNSYAYVYDNNTPLAQASCLCPTAQVIIKIQQKLSSKLGSFLYF